MRNKPKMKETLSLLAVSFVVLASPAHTHVSDEAIAQDLLVMMGRSYSFIAEQLNDLDVATAKGGMWHTSTVRNYALRFL